MLHQGFETEKSQDHQRAEGFPAFKLLTAMLGVVIQAVAWIFSSPREAVLYVVAAAILGLWLTTLFVGWITKRRTAGIQVKAKIRAAYASALAGSALNPEREALAHGR